MSRAVFAAAALLCVVGVQCQENAVKNLSPSLLECYNDDQFDKWNLLPHNIDTLIAILRKIENAAGHMDLRQMSSALLHRFRQDGIVKNPKVKATEGITPWVPLGKQFFRFSQTLKVIPGSAVNFPNNSISALERCSLHSMLSSSIDIFERNDENRVCKLANYAYRRYGRSVHRPEDRNVKEDAETLTPEQLEMMIKSENTVDPNSMYPALPPNHPGNAARLMTNLPPLSRCPTENGIVKTPWGTVSAGSVIAGIAASLERQLIRIGDLIKQQVEQRVSGYPSEANLDNKFLATLAGDLAEVALEQSPHESERFSLGADGNWNSTSEPLYYFLNANENLQMTAAEIRGDLDGLILASQVPDYVGKVSGLRLSQVLDMYYSNRGFFDRRYRACNRRAHLATVAPTETLVAQTHAAAIVLNAYLATATFSSEAIKNFSVQAVNDLQSVIPTMNNDMSCELARATTDLNSEPAVDLTIILDTTWPYGIARSMLAQLLNGLQISPYNSNFTLLNGVNGSAIISSTNSPIDFYTVFNSSNYEKLEKGFSLSKSLETLRFIQGTKLNKEHNDGYGGGKSDVVVFVPYHSTVSMNDKEYAHETLKTISEEVPDAVILFLTSENKNVWADLVDPNDIFSDIPSIQETTESYRAVESLISRIKQVPRRLVNSQCGANYEKKGESRPMTDVVGPNGINYYRIHPNYFLSDDTENPPRIEIRSMTGQSLRVCRSRELLHINSTSQPDECVSVTSNSKKFDLSCNDEIYLHKCKPYYFSISSNMSSSAANFACNDPRVCRYPDDIRFTVSYQNLVCKSGASSLLATPLLLLIALARFF